MTRIYSIALVLASVALLLGARPPAEVPQLPPDLQLDLIAKVLLFDRNLGRYGEQVTIGVIHQPENRESARAARELLGAAANGRRQVGGAALNVVAVPLTESGLSPASRTEIDLLYLAPLRATDVRAIASAAARDGLLTVTGLEDQFAEGTAVALLLGDGRPRIRIFRPAARLAGAAFSSQLLRLVEVVE